MTERDGTRPNPRPSGTRPPSALVFMTKWPEPGRAKTRLTPALDAVTAADLARCFLLDTLTTAATVDADLFLAFAPLTAARQFQELVGDRIGLIPADAPSLGIALREAQRAALALGYQRVALVGSDLPHLPAQRYLDAFAELDGADVVLGPCADGGYYLIASERETPDLFEEIAWSTEVVLDQTLARARAVGLRLALIAPCDDVDTIDDLPGLYASLERSFPHARTLALLRATTGPWQPSTAARGQRS